MKEFHTWLTSGVLLAAAFLTGFSTGLVASVGVILHEVSQSTLYQILKYHLSHYPDSPRAW